MTTQLWADQPFALIKETGILSRQDIPDRQHPAISMAQHMALTHNIIIRGLNASFNQCLSVSPKTKEAQDFLLFNQCLFEILHDHHTVEEEHMFGAIEKFTGVPGIMDKNLEEHKDFQEGLEKYRQYIYETDATDYDGQTLQALLEGFGKTMEVHLHNEIPTLLDLKDYDAAKLKALAAAVGKRFRAGSNFYRHGPLFVGCADRSFILDGQVMPFPPFPFFVPYIIKFIFEPRHSGAWRFNPCDSFSQPRPLRFLNPEK
ncbi:hypothetical protein V8E54_008067 [Elaphomyces granulatus]